MIQEERNNLTDVVLEDLAVMCEHLEELMADIREAGEKPETEDSVSSSDLDYTFRLMRHARKQLTRACDILEAEDG